MRAVFGLVGILVTVGVIVWWLGASGGGLDQTKQTIDAGNKARDQASQIAGKDTQTGERASESVTLDPLTEGGKLVGVMVAKLTPGGAYARYFTGLEKNDTIVAIEYNGNRQRIKEINDPDMAKAQIDEAYRRKGSIVVVRDEKEVTLPSASASARPGQQPKPAQSKDETQQQIDVLQGIPGGGLR